MTVSVIIATYNRAPLLDECLAHLARQPFMAGDEVIVVDNGSTDGTASVVERHRDTLPATLIHLQEPRPGKSYALGRALAAATGDILAFTDDDVNVRAGWLEVIRRVLAEPDVALIGGRVAPRWERTPPSWLHLGDGTYGRLTAPLALLNYAPEPIDLGPRTVLGANMAVRRDVIARVGGFATHVGKLRGTLLSGEDAELCRRVQAAGFRAMYRPDAAVDHWVPADRMRVGYFVNWFYWSGITNAALEANAPSTGRRLLGVPLYQFRRFGGSIARMLGALLAGNRTRAVEHAVEAAFSAGYAAQCRRWTRVPTPVEPAGQSV